MSRVIISCQNVEKGVCMPVSFDFCAGQRVDRAHLQITAATSSTPKDAPQEDSHEEPEVFAATGIDNAIDLLEVVTAKMDKASVGQKAAEIEKHPEV